MKDPKVRRDLSPDVLKAIYGGGSINFGTSAYYVTFRPVGTDAMFWADQYTAHLGRVIAVDTNKGFIETRSSTAYRLARTLKVPYTDRSFGLAPFLAHTSVDVPIWFLGALLWHLGTDQEFQSWTGLERFVNRLPGEALFRRVLRKLRPVITERGQNLLLVEALLAPAATMTRRIAQVYLKAAVAEGLPRTPRRRGKNA